MVREEGKALTVGAAGRAAAVDRALEPRDVAVGAHLHQG